ncbi:YcgN family cysteine cluster protein [Kangiella marina]|uniref:YcgN family cysteine cluster protein n=1 Tax=Kangiella marina TaxID=1079178 RepID=UPI0031EEA31A
MNTPVDKFWLTTPMHEMSHEQWESLCDGCGKCCRIQFLDDDDTMLMQTDVACGLLDTDTLRCTDYDNRLSKVPDCVQITPETLKDYYWLPRSCSYKVVERGEDLPQWHHLVSGDPDRIHTLGHSLQGKLVSERDVPEEQVEERIIEWIAITD